MNRIGTTALQRRLDGVSVAAAQRSFPGAFAKWRAGEFRPFWIANAVRRLPGGGAELAAALGQNETIVNGWGAGDLYPGWDAVCAVAAAANLSVGELEVPAADYVPQLTGDHLSDAAAAICAMQYHQAVIDAAKPLRGHLLGLPSTAAEVARVEAARKAAGVDALMAAYKQSGGHLSESAPEDPLEAVIWTNHEPEIRAFQQALFTAAGDSTDILATHGGKQGTELAETARSRAATMPRLGPIQAVNEPNTAFLFTADFTTEQAWIGDAGGDGKILTVSVSARRPGTHDRVPVTSAVRPWVRVLVGQAWADKIVAVDMSALSDANPLTAYFQVFLDASGAAIDPPEAFRDIKA
ncbi:hypothetical protein [Curtobacterium sp. RIT-PI-V]|uniref:hypothetical protein n=1 Tax=Curtobacterium sp. RIT-PI-V TaxID=3035296 RepID=UPI0021D7EBE5|nr:hypothetical protein [Curtobacterium sp. RIT-PI-V]